MEPFLVAVACGAGALHAVTGPDHLAAVTPLALERPRRGARVGLAWGLGHGVGATALALLALLALVALDVPRMASWADRIAGLALVVLGVATLARTRRQRTESHPQGLLTAFGFGCLHGASGVLALFAFAPLLALPPSGAAFFLVAFAVGTTSGMGVYAWLVSRAARPGRWLRVGTSAAGVASLGVGLVWLLGFGS